LGPQKPKVFAEKVFREQEEKEEEKPAVVLKFDAESTKNITIAELQKMKEERERIEKEKLEKEVKEEKGKFGEIDASDIIWQVNKEEREKIIKKQEETGLIGEDVEIID
jgi:hypothetical protein